MEEFGLGRGILGDGPGGDAEDSIPDRVFGDVATNRNDGSGDVDADPARLGGAKS